MEANQVDQLLMIYGNKLPASSLPVVRERLLNMDYNVANMAFGQMKDPTISLILSILVGGYGVDRIYRRCRAWGVEASYLWRMQYLVACRHISDNGQNT